MSNLVDLLPQSNSHNNQDNDHGHKSNASYDSGSKVNNWLQEAFPNLRVTLLRIVRFEDCKRFYGVAVVSQMNLLSWRWRSFEKFVRLIQRQGGGLNGQSIKGVGCQVSENNPSLTEGSVVGIDWNSLVWTWGWILYITNPCTVCIIERWLPPWTLWCLDCHSEQNKSRYYGPHFLVGPTPERSKYRLHRLNS